MKREDIINKLSNELAEKLNKSEELQLIKQYMTVAIVTEMERSPGKDLRIIQKLNPNTGFVLKEHWGMKELFLYEKFSNNFITVQRAIDKACAGDRSTAYGYKWKKI